MGWWSDIETLKSVIPGLVAMNPGGTAVAFVLAGVSLWIQSGPPAVAVASRHGVRRHGRALALLRLGGYLLDWDGGPDQACFARSWP